MQLTSWRPAPARRRTVGLAGLLVLALAAPAAGHGPRVPFAEWGGFSPSTVRCQRVIGREAAGCAATAWQARRACRSAELRGEPCDHASTDAIIVAARNRAYDAIAARCEPAELADLGFLGLFDLEADVIAFCRNWEDEAESAVFGPFRGAAPPTRHACAEAAANVADAVMRFVFRGRRQCMDHLALLPPTAPKRSDLLAAAGHRLGAAQDALASRLGSRCGPDAFVAIYGRTPGTFVADLSARADCIGGRLYIQDAVVCPAAVCGNGIVEVPETCDDANTLDGDACPGNCQR